MMLISTLSLAFYLSAPSVLATPNGAPKCGINDTAIQVGMNSASDASLGYFLDVRPAGNNNWNITIQNTAGRADYQGILMYVHQVDTPKVHLGMFTFKNQTKWKYQPLSLCQTGGITSTTAMSTFTHATPDRVAMSKNVTFIWTSDAKELDLSALVVNAAVASIDPGKSGKPRWQHLQFVGIPPTPNSGAPATLPPAAGTGAADNGTAAAGTSPTSTDTAAISGYTSSSSSSEASGVSTSDASAFVPPTLIQGSLIAALSLAIFCM